jgi:hypothetical protein
MEEFAMTYNTKLGEFCATHANWEALLSAEPFNIKIKRADDFVIFNYNQLSSDFTNEIVREARGIIFVEGEWEHPVCHAFDKFGNYGESYVPDIDWSTVTVSEKIDGSIMKLWFYNNRWIVSTNGNIYAKDATVPDIRKENFEELFWDGIIRNLVKVRYPGGVAGWLKDLNPDYTYIFEMVSPYTRVVILYEQTNTYFLGARNNITNQQVGCDAESAKLLNVDIFPAPELYPMQTFDQISSAANALPWDEEGFVCYDKNFNRCKIKSPRYVLAHFARNNNVITRKHLIDVILRGEMAEFMIYASDYTPQLEFVKQQMEELATTLNTAAIMARNLRMLERSEAAYIIKKFNPFVQPIMFTNLDHNESGTDYVAAWDVYKWERNIDNFLKFTERTK